MQQIIETDVGSSINDTDPQFPLESQVQQHLQLDAHYQHTHSTTDLTTGGTIGPIIAWSDVCVGDLIASGSFASVYKVAVNHPITPTAKAAQTTSRGFPIYSGNNEDIDMTDDLWLGEEEEEEEGYEYHGALVTSSHHSYHSQTTPSVTQKPYALKRLNAVVLDSPSKITHGIKGMMFEAQLLSQILPHRQYGRSHPNIVQMYGMSPNFMEDPVNGFLILEHLVETLDNRLQRWMDWQNMMMNSEKNSRDQHHHHHHSLFSTLFDTQHNQRKNTTLKEQLTRTKYIGYGVANAIKYLHEYHVLYRDLKPSNVGFDERGTVKLFDFDLSRRFKYDKSDDAATAKQLTECIGSLRYMSPECARGKPYGFSSDVHSFAILLWEICTLQRPYENVHTASVLVKTAFLGNERPALRKIVSPTIKQLLQKSWNPSPDMRPTMSSIVDVLRSLHTGNRSNSNGSPTALRKLVTRRKSTI